MVRISATGILAIFLICVASGTAQRMGGGAYAAGNDPHMTMGSPSQDYDFVKNSMNVVSAEVEWSKIANAKATNDNVKTLANETITQDNTVASRLVTEAQAQKIQVPNGLSGKYKKEADKLNGLSGDAFDKEYVSALIKLQHDDVGAMREEAKTSKNSSLADFATKTADQATARNDEAKTIEKQLGGK